MKALLCCLTLALTSCMCDPSAGTRNYRCAATTDCADGYACVASKCTAVAHGSGDGGCGGAATETNCGDGRDDDCDGLIDCADPDCTHKPCSATSTASVCCGVGSNETQCKNLSSDSANCGGCGLNCETGSTCKPQSNAGISTGACSCSSAGNCPVTGQTCRTGTGGGVCDCGTSSAACASGQTCAGSAGDLGLCHY